MSSPEYKPPQISNTFFHPNISPPEYKLPFLLLLMTLIRVTDEEDDDEVWTESEEAVDDNESDSKGDSDSNSNWFSVMCVAVKKIPLL